MSRNDGIQITGGTVHAGAMAAGKGARATQTVMSVDQTELLAELRASLEKLVADVHAQAGDLPDPGQATAVVELANAEAHKTEPDKPSLLTLLDKLGAAVGSVATLGGSVAAIVKIVSALSGG